jgi:hypothetical protein
MILAAMTLCVGLIAAPADVTGKWDGKLISQKDDGTSREDAALLILTQKGTKIAGTIGQDEGDRHPITSGTIDGDKIVIVAKNANNDREYRLELTLAGDELKGTIASGDRKGKVEARRRKE